MKPQGFSGGEGLGTAGPEKLGEHVEKEKTMDEKHELPLVEIETRYPQQWVLVEETSWDDQG